MTDWLDDDELDELEEEDLYAFERWWVSEALAMAYLATFSGTRVEIVDAFEAVLGYRRAWMYWLADELREATPVFAQLSTAELTAHLQSTRALAAWQEEHEQRRPSAHRRTLVPRRVVAPAVMIAPRWGVPRIDTVGDLATWLGLSLGELDWLADLRAMLVRAPPGKLDHHRRIWVPKRSGGARLLEAPKPRLAAVQRRILHEILDRIPTHDAAHGFRRGRSVASFVAPHVGRALVLRVDLEAFFATVTRGRVIGILRTAGYLDEVARALAGLTTTRTPSHVLRRVPAGASPEAHHHDRQRLRVPHLAQGAPSSPALANLAAFRLDVRLDALTTRAGARFTRYADDLAFSFPRAPSPRALDRFVAAIDAIVRDEGFAIAPHKTRVMRHGARQSLAGVVVNERAAVPREEYELLRAILHRAAREGPQHPREHLAGRIAWIAQWSAHRGDKLRAALDRIAW